MKRADESNLASARRRCLGAALASLAALAGCASSKPPPTLLHLPLVLAGVPAATPTSPAPGPVYQLVLPVRMPEYLDRGEVLLPHGAALVPLPGYRWAEPLRDAVPRLLRADLSALLGPGRLWSAPLPPGVQPQRQWRVEIDAYGADAPVRAVRLHARWSLADAGGQVPARSGIVELAVPVAGEGAAAIAEAHRRALGELARALAGHAH